MTQWERAVVLLLLLAALGGLFVHEDATSDARTPYPEPHELAADYDSHVGETVLVFGTVTAVDGRDIHVEAESEGITIELRVTDAPATVEPGGVLQVYGELRPEQAIVAQNIVVVSDSGGAEWYKYGVSVVGALGFLVVFLRQCASTAKRGSWRPEMADLLSHLLLAYSLFTVASWRVDWLDRRWVVVGVGGAAIPDLVKVDIVLPEATVEGALGIPFSYTPLSTLGGVLLVAGLIALAFERDHWQQVYGLVVTGGVLSLLGDGLRTYADGRASAWLYPLSNWRPPTPSLYVSSDPLVLVAAVVLAAVVVALDRRIADE